MARTDGSDLVEQNGKVVKKGISVRDYFLTGDAKERLAAALPKTMSVDRFVRILLLSISKTPKLLKCTPESLLGASLEAAQLGLEIGVLGHAYLIPMDNKATLIPGYKGVLDLMNRTGNMKSIGAYTIREKDEFDISLGFEAEINHKVNLLEPRGEVIGYYACAVTKDGGRYMTEPKTVEDMEKHRASYALAKSNYSPWYSGKPGEFDEMGKKTMLLALGKIVPLSIEGKEAVVSMSDEERNVTPGKEFDLNFEELLPEKEPKVVEAKAEEVPVKEVKKNPRKKSKRLQTKKKETIREDGVPEIPEEEIAKVFEADESTKARAAEVEDDELPMF